MTQMEAKFRGCSACFSRVSLLAWGFIPRRAGQLQWDGGGGGAVK